MGRPRRAGVSSFGISGTNAHVIVERRLRSSRARSEPRGRPAPVVPWVVSAKSAAALAAQAAPVGRTMCVPMTSWTSPMWGGRWRARSTFEHRAVVVGGDRDRLLAGLDELADG